jgi:hypothetical protein
MAKEFAMKRKRFSVEQIVVVLKQAELGLSVAELTRQVGRSTSRHTCLFVTVACPCMSFRRILLALLEDTEADPSSQRTAQRQSST